MDVDQALRMPRTLKRFSKLLVLIVTALLMSDPGLAQVPPGVAAPATEQRYLELIEQEQDRGGPSAFGLIEPMTGLGLLYLERRDYDRAAETLARARGVMRAAAGFDTLPEIALIAQQVRVEEARGDFAAAWELEQVMLAVAKRHVGELATVPVFRNIARKRREILERYHNGEYPPQIVLGCYYDREVLLKQLFVTPDYNPPDVCTAGDRPNVMTALLGDIRTNQLLAMEALFQNGEYASAEMWDLFTDVLSLSDQIRRWLPRTVVANERAFLDHVLGELAAYQPRNAAERRRRAEILITIADTNVLRAHRSRSFRNYGEVLEQYRQAYALLQSEGVEQTALDELFSPALPVVIPAYAPNPLQGGAAAGAAGYIDVTFEVTQRGASRKIRVQDLSEGLARADRNRLRESIRRSRFRPIMVNGEFPAALPVSLRYYVQRER